MVKAVPSRPTVFSPAVCTASAVASARCSSGIVIAASMSAATLCIVLVQSSRKSAPAASSCLLARIKIAAASSHRDSACSCSISAKSSDTSTQRAECSPPSLSAVSSLISR